MVFPLPTQGSCKSMTRRPNTFFPASNVEKRHPQVLRLLSSVYHCCLGRTGYMGNLSKARDVVLDELVVVAFVTKCAFVTSDSNAILFLTLSWLTERLNPIVFNLLLQ